MNDLALVMTVHEPYRHLVADSIDAIDRHWPGHPDILENHGSERLHAKIYDSFEFCGKPFAIMLHEDYRLCGDVKIDKLQECMEMMRAQEDILSCSLTYEPIFKTHRAGNFELLPTKVRHWPFCVNFQARVWNVSNCLEVLAGIDRDLPHNRIEHFASKYFADFFYPCMKVVSYAIPAPPNFKGFVDLNPKDEWIIPYDNIMHFGKVFEGRKQGATA